MLTFKEFLNEIEQVEIDEEKMPDHMKNKVFPAATALPNGGVMYQRKYVKNAAKNRTDVKKGKTEMGTYHR